MKSILMGVVQAPSADVFRRKLDFAFQSNGRLRRRELMAYHRSGISSVA